MLSQSYLSTFYSLLNKFLSYQTPKTLKCDSCLPWLLRPGDAVTATSDTHGALVLPLPLLLVVVLLLLVLFLLLLLWVGWGANYQD